MPGKTLYYLLFALHATAVAGYAIHALRRQAWLNRAALALVSAGVLLHTGLLAQRWLLADARQTGDGRAIPMGERLGNPAMQVLLQCRDGSRWEGWYFLRDALPLPLAAAV